MGIYIADTGVLTIDGQPTDATGCCCGACCSVVNEGSCYVTTRYDCEGSGDGAFRGVGTTCSPNPCVTGACCSGSQCAVTTQQDCPGTWQGAGTTCDPNPCPGACCVGEECSLTSEAECEGIWQGAGTTCSPANPCLPIGCCIHNGNCSQTTQPDCPGTWTAGQPCNGFFVGSGGCMSAGCEADWRALLQDAGYVPVINFTGVTNVCGQKLLHSFSGVCCGVVGGACGQMTRNVRCLGPCGNFPEDCPPANATVEVTIPICCGNVFP